MLTINPKHQATTDIDAMINIAKRKFRLIFIRHQIEHAWDAQRQEPVSNWMEFIDPRNIVLYESIVELNHDDLFNEIKPWIESEIRKKSPGVFSPNIIRHLQGLYGVEWIKTHYMASKYPNCTNTWKQADDLFWMNHVDIATMWKKISKDLKNTKNAEALQQQIDRVYQFACNWGRQKNRTRYNAFMSEWIKDMQEEPVFWSKALSALMQHHTTQKEVTIPQLPALYHDDHRLVWDTILKDTTPPENLQSVERGFSANSRLDQTLYAQSYQLLPKHIVFRLAWILSTFDPEWTKACIEYALTNEVPYNEWVCWICANDNHLSAWSEELVEMAKTVTAQYPTMGNMCTHMARDWSVQGARVVDICKSKSMLFDHLLSLLNNETHDIPEIQGLCRIDAYVQEASKMDQAELVHYLLKRIQPNHDWSMDEVTQLQHMYTTWKDMDIQDITLRNMVADYAEQTTALEPLKTEDIGHAW